MTILSTEHECTECGHTHAEKKICTCGRCMYGSCKQIDDVFTAEDCEDRPELIGELVVTMYPIFECSCGERHFWD